MPHVRNTVAANSTVGLSSAARSVTSAGPPPSIRAIPGAERLASASWILSLRPPPPGAMQDPHEPVPDGLSGRRRWAKNRPTTSEYTSGLWAIGPIMPPVYGRDWRRAQHLEATSPSRKTHMISALDLPPSYMPDRRPGPPCVATLNVPARGIVDGRKGKAASAGIDPRPERYRVGTMKVL
jgi:hypothetical protein